MFTPPQEKINQGLDIQGGLSVVLTATGEDGQAPSTEDMETSREIIESRVNALGASEAVVQVQGTDQILVQIPGMSDTQEALDTIAEYRADLEKKMQEAVLSIKKKYGKNAILKGLNFQEGATTKVRNEQIGGHKA